MLVIEYNCLKLRNGQEYEGRAGLAPAGRQDAEFDTDQCGMEEPVKLLFDLPVNERLYQWREQAPALPCVTGGRSNYDNWHYRRWSVGYGGGAGGCGK